jgi:broad specificity phosphatase PhoE
MTIMSTGSVDAPEATVLVLVRHGEAASNVEGRVGGHSPAPLTERGHRQARATADALARTLRPTAIVASDLMRTQQTAAPLAELTGLAPVLDARWRERSLGVMDGLLFSEIETRYPEEWQRLRANDPRASPPGGETVDQVFARVSEAVDDTIARHQGGRVVVISHGLAIFHALAHILGLGSPSAGLKVFTLVDNCSLSSFRHRGDRWYIETINDRAHLHDVNEPVLRPGPPV